MKRLLTGRPSVRALAILFAFVSVLTVGTNRQSATRTAIVRLPAKYSVQDDVTRAIRDPSGSLYLVDTADAASQTRIGVGGITISDHGTFSVVASHTAGSLSARRLETSVNLPGASLEPLDPSRPAVDVRSFAGSGYFIVQFGTIATDDLLDSLSSMGLEVVQYVPHQAFIVYGSSSAAATLRSHSRVRWVGPYAPEYKVSKILAAQLNAHFNRTSPGPSISRLNVSKRGTSVFDVAVFARAGIAEAAAEISAATNGKVQTVISPPHNFFNVVRIEAPVDAISAAAKIEDVFSIEAWYPPAKEDEIANQIVAGNYNGNAVAPPGYSPLAQFGVDGTGVTVAVVDDGVGIPGDGGFYVTSANAVDGPMRGASMGAYGHGHLQASIIAGASPFSSLDPGGYNYGAGIAPKANIINIPFLRPGYSGTPAQVVHDTFATLGPNGRRGTISNHSWGSNLNANAYDSLAAQFDSYVLDASLTEGIDPQVIIFSAGNQGNSGLTRPKVAKNVIAVAATENVRPTLNSSGGNTGVADTLEQLPDFSSRGPAADTRIKPDVAAPGDAVTGGRSGANPLFGDIDAFHRVSSGTSHAAPLVAGAAALFTQYWRNTNSGADPSPAMVKAALINGAVETTGLGATDPRPNRDEGWGRINLKNVLNTGAAISSFDQTRPFSDVGERQTFVGTVADGGSPVRVTLVWSDPPAAADPALVNDIDLEVIVGGTRYFGNQFSGGVSVAGSTADNRNNVENVFLPEGTTGPITIRATAKALNGDGILGNADTTDQNFALVVYNADVEPSSLNSGAVAIESGNAVIEPSECNQLRIPITNAGTGTLTGVTATISTATPGVGFPVATANYPTIGPGQTLSGFTPFLLSTGSSLACFSSIDLIVTITHDGALAPLVLPYTLYAGTPPPANYLLSTTAGAAISPGGSLVAGSQTDDAVVTVAAPFAFKVYETMVAAGSAVHLDTNGSVRIGGAGGTSSVTNASLPAAQASIPLSSPVLFPYWDDLDLRSGTTIGGGIYSEVTGSVGSRVWKLEWRARNYLAGQPQAAPNVNFAVYLYENSGSFDFVYALTGGGINSSGASATVGVQAASSGTVFSQFSFNSPSLSGGLKISGERPSSCTPGLGACVTTAAAVPISGRVVDADGQPIRNAVVTLTSADGSTSLSATNTFGYFRFENVAPGSSYTLAATARARRFTPTVIYISEAIDHIVLAADPH